MTAQALHDLIVLAQAQVDLAWFCALLCVPVVLIAAVIGVIETYRTIK